MELELEMPMIPKELVLGAPTISISEVEQKNSLIIEIEKNMNIAKEPNTISEQVQTIAEVPKLEEVHSIDRPPKIANQCMSSEVRMESVEQLLPLKRKHRA